MKIFSITYVLTLVSLITTAQDKIVVTNSKEGDRIEVKYYCTTVFHDTDVNYYRRALDETEWTRLNNKPVHWGNYKIPGEIVEQDKQTHMLTTVIDSLGATNMEGLLQLMVLMKSFESAHFSKYLGIQFTDTTTSHGTTYKYRVTKVLDGHEETVGISEAIKAGRYLPPSPPAGVITKIQKRNIGISWQPETMRYYGVNIYRNSTEDTNWKKIVKKPVMISKVSNESGEKGYPELFYRDDNLKEGVTYRYKLTSVDFFGQESPFSGEFAVPLKDRTPPLAPEKSEVRADHEKLEIALNWQYAYDRVSDLDGFNVYRSDKFDGTYTKLNQALLPAQTNQFVSQVPGPSGYYYYVSAVDLAGNEGKSAVLFVEVQDLVPPAIPKGVNVQADTSLVRITWHRNTEQDLKGYLVYRSLDNDPGNGVLLNAETIAQNTYIDRLPANTKNRFHYRVVSVDKAFNKSRPSLPGSTYLPDGTAPLEPFIKKVKMTEAGLKIDWLPAADSDLKAVELYRSSKDVQDQLVTTLPAASTSYEDKRVTERVGYAYYLVAIDSAGNRSGRSNLYHGSWALETQSKSQHELNVAYDSIGQAVSLSWSQHSTAGGYILYRKASNTAYCPLTGLIQDTAYVDNAIKKGKQYYYRIRSYGTGGVLSESDSYSIEIK
ncbi:hypothetical protein FNH22_00525 [Fulvivirga sp. M361]|uniref:fibronectin type III domain-containing protein n=1 Tax=Fulvivirga sp. M361 TaxID=2594266 RepID=UPI00117B516F|nr:hypothetical protein [Fulvivirga sp. M361]TRX62612.1 hypothetical protein FNH22_00525 [Fulvivirga sp. M361]